MSNIIGVESMVGVINGPQVKLTWGPMSGLLTSEEARAHALIILDAANASETDSFLFEFLRVNLGDSEAANAVAAFRMYRSGAK